MYLMKILIFDYLLYLRLSQQQVYNYCESRDLKVQLSTLFKYYCIVRTRLLYLINQCSEQCSIRGDI